MLTKTGVTGELFQTATGIAYAGLVTDGTLIIRESLFIQGCH
jgi:hypothetical protein